MKTIIEWAELCSDDTIRRKWIENTNNQNDWIRNHFVRNMPLALKASFGWISSPEGYDYWRGIHDDMVDNPEKYLRKRKKMFIYE